MTNLPYDVQTGVDETVEVAMTELEEDHAMLGYIESRLNRIQHASSLDLAQQHALDLKLWIEGQRNKLRGMMIRLRVPDE